MNAPRLVRHVVDNCYVSFDNQLTFWGKKLTWYLDFLISLFLTHYIETLRDGAEKENISCRVILQQLGGK